MLIDRSLAPAGLFISAERQLLFSHRPTVFILSPILYHGASRHTAIKALPSSDLLLDFLSAAPINTPFFTACGRSYDLGKAPFYSELSGQPFFSIHPYLLLTALAICSLLFFPLMSQLHTKQSCFLSIFPSVVHWLRLSTLPSHDNSLYVLQLSLVWFDSIFSCPFMDFG